MTPNNFVLPVIICESKSQLVYIILYFSINLDILKISKNYSARVKRL